jgi:4-hydroxybenzoate polyprenyltransferase
MADGDYHDIWIATAFAVVVIVLWKLFFQENEIGGWAVIALVFGGGTLIMQHVAGRERRKHRGGD